MAPRRIQILEMVRLLVNTDVHLQKTHLIVDGFAVQTKLGQVDLLFYLILVPLA
jgi:hypothetical protein